MNLLDKMIVRVINGVDKMLRPRDLFKEKEAFFKREMALMGIATTSELALASEISAYSEDCLYVMEALVASRLYP
jgi:hypothetical protein